MYVGIDPVAALGLAGEAQAAHDDLLSIAADVVDAQLIAGLPSPAPLLIEAAAEDLAAIARGVTRAALLVDGFVLPLGSRRSQRAHARTRSDGRRSTFATLRQAEVQDMVDEVRRSGAAGRPPDRAHVQRLQARFADWFDDPSDADRALGFALRGVPVSTARAMSEPGHLEPFLGRAVNELVAGDSSMAWLRPLLNGDDADPHTVLSAAVAINAVLGPATDSWLVGTLAASDAGHDGAELAALLAQSPTLATAWFNEVGAGGLTYRLYRWNAAPRDAVELMVGDLSRALAASSHDADLAFGGAELVDADLPLTHHVIGTRPPQYSLHAEMLLLSPGFDESFVVDAAEASFARGALDGGDPGADGSIDRRLTTMVALTNNEAVAALVGRRGGAAADLVQPAASYGHLHPWLAEPLPISAPVLMFAAAAADPATADALIAAAAGAPLGIDPAAAEGLDVLMARRATETIPRGDDAATFLEAYDRLLGAGHGDVVRVAAYGSIAAQLTTEGLANSPARDVSFEDPGTIVTEIEASFQQARLADAVAADAAVERLQGLFNASGGLANGAGLVGLVLGGPAGATVGRTATITGALLGVGGQAVPSLRERERALAALARDPYVLQERAHRAIVTAAVERGVVIDRRGLPLTTDDLVMLDLSTAALNAFTIDDGYFGDWAESRAAQLVFALEADVDALTAPFTRPEPS
ncbi:MAG: hypothetical protein AAF567_22135 [Actinomycetota bacterium]